jgi:secretion/DNA translocation related TadE-like protein
VIRAGRRRCDSGSASVWLLSCCALVGLVAAVTVARGVAVLARHQVESAADLAALAAAAQIGTNHDICTAARRIALVNGARMTGCRFRIAPDGRAGSVRIDAAVAVRLPLAGPWTAAATARASRLEPATTAASTRSPASCPCALVRKRELRALWHAVAGWPIGSRRSGRPTSQGPRSHSSATRSEQWEIHPWTFP